MKSRTRPNCRGEAIGSSSRLGIFAIVVSVFVMSASPASAATPEGVSPGSIGRIATIRGECPTFSWGEVDNTAYYEVVVYQLPERIDHAAELELSADREVLFTRVIGSATGWTPELERCFNLGGSYVWFVRAIYDEDGVLESSEWSQGRFFSVAAAPSTLEVEQALEVLRRYVKKGGDDTGSIEHLFPDGEGARRTARQTGAARIPADPKDGERSVLTGSAAIRGEMPDPTGESYGVAGISNSPDGAGIGAANAAGGADLVLDGTAQGVADAELSESGVDRFSIAAQTFDITNSGSGDMTLRVDGVDVVTTLTDQDTLGGVSCAGGELAKWDGNQWSCDSDSDADTLAGLSCGGDQVAKWNGSAWTCAPDDDTAPRDAGNQLDLSGNTLDVVEGPGSGLDADALDGFDSTAFSPLVHLHDDRYFTETELGTSGAGGAVHWNNLTAVPLGFADGVDNDTTYTFGSGLMIDNGQIVIDPSALSTRITAYYNAGHSHTSVAIGSDGLGLIAYYDPGVLDLKVAHCDDIPCTSASISTLDSAAAVGYYPSVAIGADGLGLISYYDATNDDLKVAHCDNVECSSATVTALDLWTDVGKHTSVAIGSDGLGLISYYDSTAQGLKVAHCQNVACTGATLSNLDSVDTVGLYTSVAIGSDGLGLISYYDITSGNLRVARCSNVVCAGVHVTILDQIGDVGRYSSMAIGSDGLGFISYWDGSNQALKVAHCDDILCTGATINTLDNAGNVGSHTSVAIGADGLGVISYRDTTNGDLKVARCHDVQCTIATLSTIDSGGFVGENTSVAIGTDGRALISYSGNNQLRVAHLPIVY